MNRGVAEERKERGKGGRERSPPIFRWHEKLWREEARFKRSNDDYVEFWSAILAPPGETYPLASFFNWDLGGMIRGVEEGRECENR